MEAKDGPMTRAGLSIPLLFPSSIRPIITHAHSDRKETASTVASAPSETSTASSAPSDTSTVASAPSETSTVASVPSETSTVASVPSETSTVASVPMKTSTASSAQMQTSTIAPSIATKILIPNVSSPEGLKQCPSLRGDTTTVRRSSRKKATFNNANVNGQNFHLSTSDREVWTVVRIECEARATSPSVVYLQCQSNGQWNGSVPDCVERLDISSFTVYFSMAGIVSGLAVFVVLILLCNIMMSKKNRKTTSSAESSALSENNIYADPYSVSEALAKSASGTRGSRSDLSHDKPLIYSSKGESSGGYWIGKLNTFVNSTYYVDAYDRWRQQEQAPPEELYHSPWDQQRGLQAQMEIPNLRWSQASLKTLGESGFRKIPRAQLSNDHSSVYSCDATGPAIGAHLHTPRPNQSKTGSRIPLSVLRRVPPIPAVDSRSGEVLLDKNVKGVDAKYDRHYTMVDGDVRHKEGMTNL